MKNISKLSIIIGFLTISVAAKAQDTLLMTNGTRIPSKVLEVNTVEVKYKKADNPDGPTFVTSRVDVAFIKYVNGSTDTLNSLKPKVVVRNIANEAPKLYKAGVKYMFGDKRISETQMYRMLLAKNDPAITANVRKGKSAKGIQYIGFLGIPTLVGGVVYTLYTAVTTEPIGTAPAGSGDYTPGLVLGIAGVACLTTSIVFKVSYKNHTAAAVKMYNEKY